MAETTAVTPAPTEPATTAGPVTAGPTPAAGTVTLAIDCGGSGIKGSVVSLEGHLLAERIRHETVYPLTPDRLLDIAERIARALPRADRVTLGMPGMISHGHVITTPHYIRTAGPFTDIDPAAAAAWEQFDMQAAVGHRLGLPALVINDAEVQGYGVIEARGLEVVLTLGTGLGSAWYDEGRVGAHLEISHAPVRKDTTYDQWIGDLERRVVGDERWSRRVLRTVEGLRAMFLWDRCYLGGGNTRYLTGVDIPSDVTVVPNIAGITGGARAWDFLGPQASH